MDSNKIQMVMDWPKPRTVGALCGFLGLTCYYRKVIKDFFSIATPLIALLKEGFAWNEATDHTFNDIKRALTMAPVLQLPNSVPP